MTTINNLNQTSGVSGGDLLPIWSQTNGDTQSVSITALSAYIIGLVGGSNGIVTQYASPNATGFTVNLGQNLATWLLLTPLAGYAAGTLVLPASPVNQQRITVNSTQSITALTVNGNGNTVNGAPTTLAANAFFTLQYDAVLDSWYRIA